MKKKDRKQYEANRQRKRQDKYNKCIKTTPTALGITAETLFPTKKRDGCIEIDIEKLTFEDKEAGTEFLQKYSHDIIDKALNSVKCIEDNKNSNVFTDEDLKNALRTIENGRITSYLNVCKVIIDMARLMFCVPIKVDLNGKKKYVTRTFQLFMVNKCDIDEQGTIKELVVSSNKLLFKGKKEGDMTVEGREIKVLFLKGRDSKERSFNGMLARTDHANETTIMNTYLGYKQRRVYGGDLSHMARDRKSIPSRFEKAERRGLIKSWSSHKNGDVVTYDWEK
jgi:hypothetical protein